MLANKQVMRLNQSVYCDGCGRMVNPYVLQRNVTENTVTTNNSPKGIHLECPNCEHDWWQPEYDNAS